MIRTKDRLPADRGEHQLLNGTIMTKKSLFLAAAIGGYAPGLVLSVALADVGNVPAVGRPLGLRRRGL